MTTTFPAYTVDQAGSKQVPIEDLVVDQWPNGNSRGRSYFSTGKYGWPMLRLVGLSNADNAALKAFYDANRLLLFDFVSPWDAVTYHNVGFISPPDPTLTSGTWQVNVALRQFF